MVIRDKMEDFIPDKIEYEPKSCFVETLTCNHIAVAIVSILSIYYLLSYPISDINTGTCGFTPTKTLDKAIEGLIIVAISMALFTICNIERLKKKLKLFKR